MSTWEDIKPWIAKLAPMLGTALGGPLGGAAGALLGQALGIKDATPESVKAAFSTGALTGDQLVQLKKAEQDFALQMAQIDIKSVQELEALAVEDRKSARSREIDAHDSWTPRGLAAIVIIGFLWSLYYVLSGKAQGVKDPMVVGMIGTLVGYISSKADMVCAYYFGSSSGSQRKDQLLYKSSPPKEL